MRESLRGRLLRWHVAIVAIVVALFSAAISYLVWRSRLDEIDAALRSEAEILVHAVKPAVGGTIDLTLVPELRSRGPASYYALWTWDGTLIDRSDASRDIPTPTGPDLRTRNGERELIVTAESGVLVLVGRDLADLSRETWSMTVTLLATGGAILALSVINGWLLVGRALAPIERINATAERMIQGDLDARIPVEQVETDLGQVARALNDAFDRLRSSIDRQRRFTADASHELRTPIATISTEVQWALSRERSADAYRESLEVCSRAAVRMQSTVERLLALARTDDSLPARAAVDVDLDELARHVVDDVRPLAESRNVQLTRTGQAAIVHGHADELREALTNVVVNAIRYNVEGGSVTVSVAHDEREAQVRVTDTGVGIAAGDLPSIFDPFFRADSSRSHDAGGAGLGLTLTKAIVERHRGRISCESAVGRGTTMTIALPLSGRT